MKVLIASDFYSEYELYETDDLEDLIEVTRRCANGEDFVPDETKHTLIGSQDDYFLEDVKAEADVTLFITDFIEDEEKDGVTA